MHFLQYTYDRVHTSSIHAGGHFANVLTRASDTPFITILPFARVASGIPCEDVFVRLIGGGLGFFLVTLLAVAGGIGGICIVLGGLLRIAALTTPKEEDKKERMFLSKFAFICAGIILVPALIFFLLLFFLPNWFGLGDKTCN